MSGHSERRFGNDAYFSHFVSRLLTKEQKGNHLFEASDLLVCAGNHEYLLKYIIRDDKIRTYG